MIRACSRERKNECLCLIQGQIRYQSLFWATTLTCAIAPSGAICITTYNGSNQRRQLISDSTPVALNRPLHLNCYAAIATQIELSFTRICNEFNQSIANLTQ